jgi:hypothetical protein
MNVKPFALWSEVEIPDIIRCHPHGGPECPSFHTLNMSDRKYQRIHIGNKFGVVEKITGTALEL